MICDIALHGIRCMGMICDILLTPAKTYKNHPVAVEFLAEIVGKYGKVDVCFLGLRYVFLSPL